MTRPARLSPRDRILAAAPDVLRRTGVAKFGLVEVARHAGVSRQTIYNHFDRREELLGALLVQEMFAKHLPLQRELGNKPASPENLVNLLVAELEIGRQYPLFDDMLDPVNAPRVAEIVFNSHAVADAREAAWLPILERYRDVGLLRHGVPLPEMVRWITYQQFWLLTQPNIVCGDDRDALMLHIRSFVLPCLIVSVQASAREG
ncbi:TetR/AcrR family transcriptional regulator [Nocardioides sp. GCM10030258]|uniref:TetR/AcrR family transcriptional regulator n=1 Tax=unclassified Nocardioides TaxID=2615069 RepID=UPI003620841E